MKKTKVYGCPRCEKIFESMDLYTTHRKDCHANKEQAFSSLRQLGLTESMESYESRQQELKFQKYLDDNFKAGKF